MPKRVTFDDAYEHARQHECYLKKTKGEPFGEGYTLYEKIRDPRWREPFQIRAAFIKTLPKVIAHINEFNKSRKPVSELYIDRFKEIPWIENPKQFMIKKK